MEKLTADQIKELRDLLLTVPATQTVEGCRAILAGLPSVIVDCAWSPDRFTRVSNLIVDVNDVGRLVDGRLAIEVLLSGSIRAAAGLEIENNLRMLRSSLIEAPPPLDADPIDEQITGVQSHLLSVRFLIDGARFRRSVARLTVHRYLQRSPDMAGLEPRTSLGTGWMLAPRFLITCHHVVNARNKNEPAPTPEDFKMQAEHTIAEFDFLGVDKEPIRFSSKRLIAASSELDYAILELETVSMDPPPVPLASFGILPVKTSYPEVGAGTPLNCVGHPAGRFQEVAFRRNDFVRFSSCGRFIQYLTDTEPGSSGSPIASDDWLVLAMHRGSAALTTPTQARGETIRFRNEGVVLNSILNHRDFPQEVKAHLAQGDL